MNKLERLQEIRERTNIKFKKSFRCQDAEKNIHLLDKNKFFKKFIEKLNDKGYKSYEDLTFEVIRYKYDYAQRHHVGKTYEWKYFYDSTFEISDELIDYLLRHNFIYKKLDIKEFEENCKKLKLPKQEKTLEEKIVELNEKINKSKEHILFHEEKLKESKQIKDIELITRYSIVLQKYKSQLRQRQKELKDLLKEYENKG